MHHVVSSRPGARRGPLGRYPGRHRAGALIATATAAGLALAGLAGAPASATSMATSTATSTAGSPAPRVPLQVRPPAAAQQPLDTNRAAKLPADVRQVCPTPAKAGVAECMSLIRTDTRHRLGVTPGQAEPGYAPADLQSAYNLTAASASGGTGETVAVVDAFDDPVAASDLAVYRAQYGLPACSISTGAGCVTKVNEQGAASPLPQPNKAWAAEISLDLDMVSAICPNCHLLLVEATTNSLTDLGTSDDTAVHSGALFVSDSWNAGEFPGENLYDNTYYNHPGVAITVSADDSGYGTGWPASAQYVTSVGGTTLTQDTGVPRGWDETAWPNAASGCSGADQKPSWQAADDTAPDGCLNRTENDVAAVASPNPGVATYDTYQQSAGWSVAGGTSVSTPIIASVYALAGNPTPGTYPASYPYQASSAADLYDITVGSNGACEPARQYLCNAGPGFDGPTGMGTPDGTGAFANTATGNVVTVPDPGVQDVMAVSSVFVQMAGTDSDAAQTLTWTAHGLPAGLSISASTGRITGITNSTAGTSAVKVTATDTTGVSGSTTFNMVVVPSMATSYHPGVGPFELDINGKCMDDANNSSTNGNKVQIWTCNQKASQRWQFVPDGNPGGAGTVKINGKCLDIKNRGTANESLLDLFTCNSGANQQWYIVGSAGQLFNPVSAKCLTDPGGSATNGTQLWIFTCSSPGALNQAWIPPASPVQSGVAGKCLDDTNDSGSNGAKIQIWTCNLSSSQKWTVEPDNTIRINNKCLDVIGRSKLDGAEVQLFTCSTNNSTNANQHWILGPAGQLYNENSGRCLDDPGNSTVNGTVLVQEDCYGQAGEIWAAT
ncbi:MAG TPA: ricin-type beta-trefoil lectin domain protein [Streptosporangiaceae bacterium]